MPVISAKGIVKRFGVYSSPMARLMHTLGVRCFGWRQDVTVLNGVDLEVMPGEVVGIVGANGAGKSTFLQIICGTLRADSGVVHVAGRLAALLELGAGFNSEFTGRENIRLCGAIYGLSAKEIEEKIPLIESFAEIGDYFDRPVRTYSSGMFVRLAFSLVAHVDATVLVVDEALAVGDAYFQQKCMRFLKSFRAQGGAILFVSHDISAVAALCDKALFLHKASIGAVYFGRAQDICKLYLDNIYAGKHNSIEAVRSDSRRYRQNGEANASADSLSPCIATIGDFVQREDSIGVGGGRIVNVWFERDHCDGDERFVRAGERVRLCLLCQADTMVGAPAFGFMLKDRLGQYILAESTDVYFRHSRPALMPGESVRVEFEFNFPELIRGVYMMNFAFADGFGDDHKQLNWLHDAMQINVIEGRLVQGFFGAEGLEVKMVCGIEFSHENSEAKNNA